jgi:hypothetical protein
MISFESLNLELVDDGGKPLETTRAISISDIDGGDLRYCKMVSMPDSVGVVDEVYSSFYKPTKQFAIECVSDDKLW